MAKGASHIDWAISLGLFFVYLLSLLIFLRPGLEEAIDRSTLVDVLEAEFENYVDYDLETTPIFLKHSTTGFFQLQITFIGGFPIDGASEDFAMVDVNENFLPFSLSGNTLSFDAFIIGNDVQNVFWLNYIEGINYNNPAPSQSRIILSDVDFGYELGATEIKKGIDKNQLDALEAESNLKQTLKYPEANGFLISIIDSSSYDYLTTDTIYTFDSGDLTSENVFVKESKDIILNIDGSEQDVIINIRIW